MVNFDVEPSSLRDSAEAATAAAEAVDELGLGVVSGLTAALPGSRAADKAARLHEHWERATASWSDDTSAYAEKLTSAAQRYEAGDEAAGQAFGGP